MGYKAASRAWLLALGAVLLLAGSAMALQPRPKPAGTKPPVTGAKPGTTTSAPATSPAPRLKLYSFSHYFFYSDLPDEEVRFYGRHMDLVHSEYARRFQTYKPREDKKFDVYLYSKREDYARQLEAHDINATNTGGMFILKDDFKALCSFTDRRSRADVREVLQHEGFHQFVRNYIGDQFPTWINEGMAQYFEDGVIMANGAMTLGLTPSYRVETLKATLKDDKLAKFADLLQITDKEWHETLTKDLAKGTLLYAQAWSVCHYFIHAEKGRYRESFSTFMLMLSKGKEASKAFSEAFGGKDIDSFAGKWREYVKDLEADPLTTAVDRMHVLGLALITLRDRELPMPRTVDDLRSTLQRLNFTCTRTHGSTKTTYKASEDSLFTFPGPPRQNKFELVAAAKGDLPPGFTAPGLKPQPTLTWYKNASGELVSDVEYK